MASPVGGSATIQGKLVTVDFDKIPEGKFSFVKPENYFVGLDNSRATGIDGARFQLVQNAFATLMNTRVGTEYKAYPDHASRFNRFYTYNPQTRQLFDRDDKQQSDPALTIAAAERVKVSAKECFQRLVQYAHEERFDGDVNSKNRRYSTIYLGLPQKITPQTYLLSELGTPRKGERAQESVLRQSSQRPYAPRERIQTFNPNYYELPNTLRIDTSVFQEEHPSLTFQVCLPLSVFAQDLSSWDLPREAFPMLQVEVDLPPYWYESYTQQALETAGQIATILEPNAEDLMKTHMIDLFVQKYQEIYRLISKNRENFARGVHIAARPVELTSSQRQKLQTIRSIQTEPDYQFIVRGERIPVHKEVLKLRSNLLDMPVLRSIDNGFEIDDLSPKVIRAAVDLIYRYEMNIEALSFDELNQLYALLKSWEVDGLNETEVQRRHLQVMNQDQEKEVEQFLSLAQFRERLQQAASAQEMGQLYDQERGRFQAYQNKYFSAREENKGDE